MVEDHHQFGVYYVTEGNSIILAATAKETNVYREKKFSFISVKLQFCGQEIAAKKGNYNHC
jgi:hypothetical protein